MTAHRPPKAEATAGNPLPIIPTGVSMRTVALVEGAVWRCGHERTPANTYNNGQGRHGPKLGCLQCRRATRNARERAARAAARVDKDALIEELVGVLKLARYETCISASNGVDFNRTARMKRLRATIEAALAKAHHPEEVLK
jgi:hypothetical protein